MDFDSNGRYIDENGILYTRTRRELPGGMVQTEVHCNAEVVRCALCGEARVVAPRHVPGDWWFEWHKGCGKS